jgi:hypothetical protein
MEVEPVSKEINIEKFIEDFLDPAPRPKKPAAEIMWSGTVPTFRGPRLDMRRGRKVWVTRLNQKPDLRRFTNQMPML